MHHHHSAALVGVDAIPVTVEADIANALPHFSIVGLPDKSVQEARERVRVAMKSSGLQFPRTKVTVNLAPADCKKEGSGYDLAIAAAILSASGALPTDARRRIIIGELAFDGKTRPVPGVLPIALMADRAGFDEIILPAENADEAALAGGVQIIPVRSLAEIALHLRGEKMIAPHEARPLEHTPPDSDIDFADIRGQTQAKRALEIAAAGSHNILFTGPPGAGKSLLAKALPSILPEMSRQEMLEVTAIHSVAGLTASGGLVSRRPFRSPHHTISGIAMIGGGSSPKPGEISLAHHGVLFLDELPEFSRTALENLRQPLEDGRIIIARAHGTVRFPASFMLVAARNPCPCGFADENDGRCTCTPSQVHKYRTKISGPILDRFDMHLRVERVTPEELFAGNTGESSASVRQRTQEALQRQHARHDGAARANARMTAKQVDQHCVMDADASALLRHAAERLELSARALMRVKKVARTIADLGAEPNIAKHHVAEALHYREA